MGVITKEIERALEARLYYLAILGALALPDICAALESADGQTTGQKYKDWWDLWMASLYPEVTSLDIYSMRCGVVHQGRFGHPKMQFARILFTLPDPGRNVFRQIIFNDALSLDPTTFCRGMIEGVSRWYAAKQNDANVKTNWPQLLRLYENGLAPYFVGIPIIA